MIHHRGHRGHRGEERRSGGATDSQGLHLPIYRSSALPLFIFLRVLCVLCGYFFDVATVTGAPQEVVLVNGESFAGELDSVTDGVVAFRRWTTERTAAEAASPSLVRVKLGEVVRWGNPVWPRGRTILVLSDGGRLVTAADWAGGAPVRLVGGKFVVLSDLFGEVTLAREAVRGIVFAPLKHAEEREKLVERVLEEPSPNPVRPSSPQASLKVTGKTDALILTNGDRVRGELIALERGSLTIKTEGGEAKVPLSRVNAVEVGSRLLSVVSRQSKNADGLRDGSLVYADEVAADEKELKLKVGKSISLAGGTVGDVVFLQSLGGRVVYLSDLEAVEYRHVPYLEVGWPLERDRNVLGWPLVVGGKRYLKGLGMHSAGRVSYRLDGKYKRFEAAVAIDDAADGRGSVTFGVYVLRDGKLSEAYKSGIVRGGDAPQRVSVDVAGAQGMTLVVDYAERGDEMDRADWLDARVVKE
jgi:hypothetical protein